jgi:Gliding motility associated protein GldN
MKSKKTFDKYPLSIKKISIVFYAILLPLFTSAQVSDLMNNKDITWIVESYNEFMMSQAHEKVIGKQLNGIVKLKYINLTKNSVEDDFIFQSILMDAVKKGTLNIYQDSNCTIPKTYKSLNSIDTISMFTPEPNSSGMKIIENEIDPSSIYIFRARQIVYFNAKKIQFGLRTISIALIKKIADEQDNLLEWKTICWIKATDILKEHDLNDKDITWAQRNSLSGGVLISGYNFTNTLAKTLKATSDTMPIWNLQNALIERPDIPFYNTESSNPKTKLESKERYKLHTITDTVIGLDNKKYIIKNLINADDCHHLKLVQNWYWNNKKQRLEIWLLAIAPVYKETDNLGNYLYLKPAFYRRTDD